MSFGREPQPFIEDLDGNSHLTQFVDWSAQRHVVLYVAAWGDMATNPEAFIPTDNYNGITVAASEESDPLSAQGYDKFGSSNWLPSITSDASGDRTSIDLLAPGTNVIVLGPPNDAEYLATGSSHAAPHVTGAAALLHQYAQQQIDLVPPNPRFGSNSQRHEVMKAVMLNSADKLAGVHGSTRTILDASNRDWTQSEAFGSQFTSLDDQMGAGHLNVRRAVQQFSSGEYNPGTVPLLGWDYHTIGGSGSRTEYIFDQPLAGDQYIAITLTWDRRVELTDPDNTYSFGDDFFDRPFEQSLNNLDVYLMRADSDDLVLGSVWVSRTWEDNVEHIFFNDFDAGEYKIVVNHNNVGGIGDDQNYAIAWWFGNPSPPGDHNSDGSVNAADYVVWRANDGTQAGYDEWQSNFGDPPGSGSLASVPEPSAFSLMTATILALSVVRRSSHAISTPANYRYRHGYTYRL